VKTGGAMMSSAVKRVYANDSGGSKEKKTSEI
jgi:hypothetical protein